MLKELPAIRTKFSIAEFTESLIKGWKNITGEYPKKESVNVIISQWSLETGGNSCWCYNICNIKAVDDSTKTITYCALNGVWEMIKGERITLPKSDPGSWFRAFETLDDGVAFYLDFLKNHRYKKAWVAIEAGKPAEFALLLKQLGYYTASVDDYTKSMNYFFNKFMKDSTFETVMLKINPPTPEVVAPTAISETISQSTVSESVAPEIATQPIITTEPAVIISPQSNIFQNIINFISKFFK